MKRPSILETAARARQAQQQPAAGGPGMDQGEAEGAGGGFLTTALVLDREVWTVLRDVAFVRARRAGGRASMSGVIRGLIDQHLAELRAEAQQMGAPQAAAPQVVNQQVRKDRAGGVRKTPRARAS